MIVNAILLLIAIWVVFTAAYELDWKALYKDTARRQLSMAAVLVITAIWALQTSIREGLEIHFLGLTALTLMLGWRLSLLIASIAAVLVAAVGVSSWSNLASNWLLGAVWPVTFSYLVFVLVYSYMHRHLFIYIFFAGFFNAVFALVTTMLLVGTYTVLTGEYSWMEVKEDYWLIMPLVALPEGLINGVTIAALVVYKPEWVSTFRDRDYLFREKE